MAKVVHGEFSAYMTPGGVRFQQNNKMVSEKAIPPEVAVLLRSKLEQPQPERKFPMPTPEERERLRAESLQVPEELKLTPEEEAQRAVTGIPDNEAPLEPDDFDDEPGNEIVGAAIIDKGITGKPIEPTYDPNFLESVSIHSAPIEAIAQALYDRFGIYTVYLRQLPQNDEINPLTGEMFTKYHLGIAYQAAIAAANRGTLDRQPELNRQNLDAGREASANFQDSFTPVPYTVGQARRANSFDYRTSVVGSSPVASTEIVHEKDPATGELRAVQREIPPEQRGRQSNAPSRMPRGDDEDEPLLEPPIFGTRPIVRPDW